MAFSDRRLSRAHPETDSRGSIVATAKIHSKSRTRSSGYQKPYPRIFRTEPEPKSRNVFNRRIPGELRKLCKLNSGKPGNPVCSRLVRSAAVRAGQGGSDVDGETSPEAVNLAAWGGESGRGAVRGERSRVQEGWGGRISEIQFFGKRTFGTRSLKG